MNLMSTEYNFLKDFRIGGDVILPFSVYLKLIADIYLNCINKDDMTNTSIVFENIHINNVILRVPLDNDIALLIMVMIGNRSSHKFLFHQLIIKRIFVFRFGKF